jgi:hypothetical protein
MRGGITCGICGICGSIIRGGFIIGGRPSPGK